jgi:hypothetical protein
MDLPVLTPEKVAALMKLVEERRAARRTSAAKLVTPAPGPVDELYLEGVRWIDSLGFAADEWDEVSA